MINSDNRGKIGDYTRQINLDLDLGWIRTFNSVDRGFESNQGQRISLPKTDAQKIIPVLLYTLTLGGKETPLTQLLKQKM